MHQRILVMRAALTPFFFVALLTRGPWRCVGSEDEKEMITNASTPLRCEPATEQSNVCAFINSHVHHFVVSNESEAILQSVSVIKQSKSNKCNQFLAFTLCFYLFRHCELCNTSDPSSGLQLKICENKCSGVKNLKDECVDESNFQTVLEASNNNPAVYELIDWGKHFNCYDPSTYTLPEVPISNTSCDNISSIDSLLPSAGYSSSISYAAKVGASVGTPLVFIILIIVVATLTVVVLKLRSKKTSLQRRLTEREQVEYELRKEHSMDHTSIEDIRLSSEERMYYIERFSRDVIAFDHLQMAETIGEGTFGIVCKAILVEDSSTLSVAVKMAKNLSSKQELRSLLNESLLMKRFDHPNIVGLLGVCFDTPDGYPYLILPFMANGNIRDYLKDKRIHPTNISALPDDMSVKTLVTMCVDVAKGMEYLSSNKFVHRDLAARNCMLDEKGIVRVGDFGLARDVYSHLYYQADKHSKIPVKWSAPEMLSDGLCTEKSDVWSYGVVCWEVFSLGSIPYPGVTNYDIPQYIESGERLKKPSLCPQNMYDIVESCWKIKPEDRPNFKQLVANVSMHFN